MTTREGPWVWMADRCIVCGTSISSSKVPVEAAREEIMIRELAYYYRRHIITKHPEVKKLVYEPDPQLMPVSVRAFFERNARR